MATVFAAIGAPAAYASQAYEQIDRSDGVGGSAPLFGGATHDPVISDDGRVALVEFSSPDPSWVATAGIWRRDIDTNHTTPVVADASARITGFTDDGKTLSFVTSSKLVSADTNTLPDLYSYTLATKAIALISRVDGTTGAATGLSTLYGGPAGSGFVTRDGKSAVFAAPAGVERRDLATGHTLAVTTDPGDDWYPHVGARFGSATLLDGSASASGSVFITGTTINTPTARIPMAIDSFGAPGALATVSDDGAVVGYSRIAGDASVDTTGLMLVNTAAGTQRRVDLSAAAPDGYLLVGFSADHSSVTLWKVVPGAPYVLESVNLTTGAVTNLGFLVGAGVPTPSHNLHYALTNGLATAAPGYALPGGVDLPSASRYAALTVPCKIGLQGGFGGGPVQLSLAFRDYGTPVKSFTITVRNWLGFVVQTSPVTTSSTTTISTGGSNYKITVTTTYADNRTTSDTWSLPAQPACKTGF